MKEITFLLGALLVFAIVIGIKLKFYSYLFGEGGLLGPADDSLSHEIENLVKLRDRGLINPEKYEEMKDEILRRPDAKIERWEKLLKRNIITPEEFEDIKKRIGKSNR